MRQIRTSSRSKMSEGGKAIRHAPTRWLGPLQTTVASCSCGATETFETRDANLSSDYLAIRAGWQRIKGGWLCAGCKTVA